ncbi:MAG: glycosyltransferase [Bacteroidota bacterium]
MKPRVLVAVLDWGLGHATRIVPLIRALMARGIRPVVASSGQALEFLRREFPKLEIRELPAYGVRYPIYGNLLLQVFAQSWQVLRAIRKEHDCLNDWCKQKSFDLIISDHRYGCHNKEVRSVFIGHQLSIPVTGFWRLFSGAINRIHWSMIRRFDVIWVPDHPDRRLSGALSCADLHPLKFIGPLSRFSPSAEDVHKKYAVMAIVSGPDPQRSAFAERAEEQLAALDAPCLLVTGEPGSGSGVRKRGNLEILPHLDSAAFAAALRSSGHVLSRSGYTSLMDYAALGIRPWLVPTPGMPEQEYLARRLQAEGIAPYQDQRNFSVKKFLDDPGTWSGFSAESQGGLLEQALRSEPALADYQVG